MNAHRLVAPLLPAVVLALVGACVTTQAVDPLAKQRAALKALEAAPPSATVPAHAQLILTPALLALELQRHLDQSTRQVGSFRIPVPFLGEIGVVPTVVVDDVHATRSDACPGCVSLTVGLSGTLAPASTSGPSTLAVPAVPFTAQARGTFEVLADPVPKIDGGGLNLRAVAVNKGESAESGESGWTASVELGGFVADLSDELSAQADAFLKRLIEGEVRPELQLAHLPNDDAFLRLRGLQTRAEAGALVVDLAFMVLDAGVVADAETAAVAGDPAAVGFLLAIPERTLLGLARAAAFRTPPDDGWLVEPTALALENGRFELRFTLWKMAAVPEARELRATGDVVLDAEGLRLTPDHVEQTGGSDTGFNPMEFLVRSEVLRRTEQALNVVVPVAAQSQVGAGRRVVRLVDLRQRDALLLVQGQVDMPTTSTP